MEQYVGDFEIERKAREKAVGKLSELHKRVENLEKEKKDLRRQLNQQAANQCQVEFAELEVRAHCNVELAMRICFLLQDPN